MREEEVGAYGEGGKTVGGAGAGALTIRGTQAVSEIGEMRLGKMWHVL